MSGLIAMFFGKDGTSRRSPGGSSRRPSSPLPFTEEELNYLHQTYQYLPSETDYNGMSTQDDDFLQNGAERKPIIRTFEGILPSDQWNLTEAILAQLLPNTKPPQPVYAAWLFILILSPILLVIGMNRA